LKEVFPHLLLFDFIRYVILGIWVTIGAPFLFQSFRDNKKQKYIS
jgi:hypothetical protein